MTNWDEQPPRRRVLHAVMPWWRPVFLDEPEYAKEQARDDREREQEAYEDDTAFYYAPDEPTDG